MIRDELQKLLQEDSIIEIINEYDCEPLIHIRQDENNRKYWCHAVDFLPTETIYVMVQVSDEDIGVIKEGQIDLRTILERSERYLLLWGKEITIRPCGEHEIADDCLPKPGVKLMKWPSDEKFGLTRHTGAIITS